MQESDLQQTSFESGIFVFRRRCQQTSCTPSTPDPPDDGLFSPNLQHPAKTLSGRWASEDRRPHLAGNVATDSQGRQAFREVEPTVLVSGTYGSVALKIRLQNNVVNVVQNSHQKILKLVRDTLLKRDVAAAFRRKRN